MSETDSSPERGGRGLMVAVLIASAFMCIGSVGGAFYFAWQAARNVIDREQEARDSAALAQAEGERAIQQARVQQLAGLIAKSSVTGGLPQQIHDEQGKPLLSWRVAILSKSDEHADLFKQFRLNEAWDSPHNRSLMDRRPEMFAPPADSAASATQTYLCGFTMEGAAFGPPRLKASLRPAANFSVGIDQSLVVFESAAPIEWTKPDQLEWKPGAARPALAGPASGRDSILTISADGRIHEIKRSLPDETLRLLFDIRREKRPDLKLTPDMRR